MNSTDVVLWWHFHQPDYREPGGEHAHFPWVRMHSLRAYTDLVEAALGHGPKGMTFNVVPSLADQLVDLAEGRVEDRHLGLARRVAEGDDAACQDAFLAHAAPTPVPPRPLPRFDELRALASVRHRATRRDALDACVLFNLSWCGFTASARPDVRALLEKGEGYSASDLSLVLSLSREMAGEVLPRLKRAREQGAVHLTTTPYTHPILPLLIDTQSAREATHDGGAPPPFGRPDDAERQVRTAIDRHEELLGHRPLAMWPGEGSLSEAALEIFARCGVQVVASDEELLRKSLEENDREAHLYPWRHVGTGVGLLFRDRALSDDWGFVYRDLEPDDAARGFVEGAEERRGAGGVVPVILDGENPFERFAHAGRDHLAAFARACRGRVRFVSPEEAVTRNPRPLKRLATGSWINANFDIWAGDDEDRRAWGLLKAVREAIDLDALDEEARLRAETHLFAAEGSDWFWWYGPEFSTPDRPGFDALFRRHLEEAARAAGKDPEALAPLDQPILSLERMGRQRRPLPMGSIEPDADLDTLLPWANALRFGGGADQGSMHRGAALIAQARVLTTPERLHVLVLVRDDVDHIELLGEVAGKTFSQSRSPGPLGRDDETPQPRGARFDVPFDALGAGPLGEVALQVKGVAGSVSETAPVGGPVSVIRPPSTWFEA